jgi:hypothetical protein
METAVGAYRIVTVLDLPGGRLNVPPPLATEKGARGMPMVPSKIPVEFESLVRVMVWVADWLTGTLPKSTDKGLIDKLIVSTPVPVNETLHVPGVLQFELVALWVMDKVAVAVPKATGEKPIWICLDWPGGRLNEPPPLITKNGLERFPTVPSRESVEFDKFVILRVWVAAWPTTTSPKLTEVRLTSRLILADTPFPLRGIE